MQQARISREIEFVGDANQEANVKGNLLPERRCIVDYFDGKVIDETNFYTITVGGTSDAIAVSGGGVPGFTVATGTVDQQVCFIATPLVFDISENPVIEAKVNIADVSGTSFFFGFSDAVTETTPDSTIDYAGGTLAAAATDAAGFVCDADKGSSALYCATIATGGTVAGALASPAITWTDGISHTLRVELKESDAATPTHDAYFYCDGIQVGFKQSAVTDVPFCAMFNFGTRANDGTNAVYVRYLAKFSDIP